MVRDSAACRFARSGKPRLFFGPSRKKTKTLLSFLPLYKQSAYFWEIGDYAL
jgi:hypothetical protein